MKIIFCLLAEPGHINPFIGTAQALKARGHEVLITSPSDISVQMQRSGLSFSSALISSEATGPRGQDLVEFISDKEKHRALIEGFFMHGIAPHVEPLRSFLDSERPDGVVVDPMNYAAVIAAQLLGLPWISVSTSLTSVLPEDLESDVLKIIKALAPHREKVFKSFGFLPAFRAVDTLSPYLNITFATKDFVGDRYEDVKLVGPAQALGTRGDEVSMISKVDERPLVYVSFGSQVFYFPEVFKKIIKACEDLPVKLVISIGDLADESGWESTEDVQFYRYAPQLEILKKAVLFITHGGANSVMEGLAAGVPLLVSPICNDQDHQAYFIKQSGVGAVLDLQQASVDEICLAIKTILYDENVRDRIAKVSQSYQQNGSVKAAQLIEEVLSVHCI